ncbi:metal-binding protein [Peptostreptococcus sp. MV1]|uniref:cysteine-rich small domain-containing protein n=1 Tax=Peptostreptococcus sp. MV1 TaxID=1219626 RepID=UPI0005104C6E|nr:cysteine-rich small domain-containing protein [Peptostreptococcus sp. MV1]KGF11166.1 metal-binding protein [Peptostreptococcus sp. MV1]
MDNSYKFFSNRDCKYFPCHKTSRPEDFNCLFCYCPLYTLGDKCGGNFKYRENGIKDCTDCSLPHKVESYEYIIGKFSQLAELAKKSAY